MEQGVINIILDNVSEAETMRLKEIIHILISQGSLSIRNGRSIIHYDNDAKVQKIEHEFIKWKYNPNLTKTGAK